VPRLSDLPAVVRRRSSHFAGQFIYFALGFDFHLQEQFDFLVFAQGIVLVNLRDPFHVRIVFRVLESCRTIDFSRSRVARLARSGLGARRNLRVKLGSVGLKFAEFGLYAGTHLIIYVIGLGGQQSFLIIHDRLFLGLLGRLLKLVALIFTGLFGQGNLEEKFAQFF